MFNVTSHSLSFNGPAPQRNGSMRSLHTYGQGTPQFAGPREINVSPQYQVGLQKLQELGEASKPKKGNPASQDTLELGSQSQTVDAGPKTTNNNPEPVADTKVADTKKNDGRKFVLDKDAAQRMIFHQLGR